MRNYCVIFSGADSFHTRLRMQNRTGNLNAKGKVVFPVAAPIVNVFCQILDQKPAKSAFRNGRQIGIDWHQMPRRKFSARHFAAIVYHLETESIFLLLCMQFDSAAGSVIIGVFDNIIKNLGQDQFDRSGFLCRQAKRLQAIEQCIKCPTHVLDC